MPKRLDMGTTLHYRVIELHVGRPGTLYGWTLSREVAHQWVKELALVGRLASICPTVTPR